MPEKTVQFPSIKDVPESSWEKLAQKKICFGHQSVGYNIIDGINGLMKENPQIGLKIAKVTDPSNLRGSYFAHFWVGENMDPGSKIDAFSSFFEKTNTDRADIAFFKFCYVDMTTKTDVQNLFNDYKNTMAGLIEAYPRTTFVHVTVPLTSRPTGIKGWLSKGKNLIKRIIGRPVFDYNDNINRNRYNDMLRKEYDGKASIFDLANIESTLSDETRSSFNRNGKTYYTLAPDYTYDGGHLNELGRKKIAEHMLVFLASLAEKGL